MGVSLSSSRKFLEAAKEGNKKAVIAMEGVRTILSYGKLNNSKEKNILLKSIVNSTLLYGAEMGTHIVWKINK